MRMMPPSQKEHKDARSPKSQILHKPKSERSERVDGCSIYNSRLSNPDKLPITVIAIQLLRPGLWFFTSFA